MSHTISNRIRIADTDSALGAIIEYNIPVSGDTSTLAGYACMIDGSYVDGTSAETISLGVISSATAMLITSTQDITLSIDDENISITAGGTLFSNGMSFSTLKISNDSGETALIKGMVWGD